MSLIQNIGDDWAYIFTNNLKYILFFAGVIMIIISPLYLFRCLKKRQFDNIGKLAIISMFGVAFFLAGLLWEGV